MKLYYLFPLLLSTNPLAGAQQIQFKAGKEYNESVDSTAVFSQIAASLRRLAPGAKDVSWGHIFCTKCPKDGTYSYYEAEFYQGDEQGKIVFNESAQPIAFRLKIELMNMPNAVQDAIGKRVKKLERDFQKINLEAISFNIKERMFYKVIFYIPTEDKKHWTQYDELVFTASGGIANVKDND